jgi:hypothetical protein
LICFRRSLPVLAQEASLNKAELSKSENSSFNAAITPEDMWAQNFTAALQKLRPPDLRML